jgi:RNA exonuclease 1
LCPQEEDPADLHSRVGFISSSQLSPPSASKSKVQDLVALDCELFYTTAGLSLARLTIVSSDGDLLYDTHVLPPPSSTIIDLNTRYSGIQEQDLEKAEKDLVGVREEMRRWVGEDTVMVGHGVENDLRALRLVHRKVIDTAIVRLLLISRSSGITHF